MPNKLDEPKTTIDRIEIINNKRLLYKIYTDYYEIFKKELKDVPKGKIIELGSGAGFIKEFVPTVITTDILDLPNVDMAHVDATKLPFKNNSVSAIAMLNTLHHINDVEAALGQFDKKLKKGGKVIMIEPWNSIWGRFVYQNFHHEEFDPSANWKLKNKGPLSGGNGAIPWIIFNRDKEKFEKKFPSLKITKLEPHTPFLYLLSGGFSKRQFIPNLLIPFAVEFEKLLQPFYKQTGMFVTIVLQKR